MNHNERAHSSIGASSSERWFNCPASVKLSEGVEDKTSSYAEEGTAAHELGEWCIEKGKSAIEGLGMVFNGYNVTEEMANAVQVYVDHINEVTASCSGEYDLNIEERFSLDYIDKELFGTNDCSVFDYESGDMHVIDYKHGAGKLVHAENNTQLLYYALGVYKDLPYVNDVYLTIVQPRRLDEDGQGVRTWKVDAITLSEFEETLAVRVKEVRDASSSKDIYSYAKGGDHCTFCKAKPFCKELRNKCLEQAQLDFDDLPEQVALPKPGMLSEEQLVKVMEVAPLVANWVQSVKEYALEQAKLGKTPEGFKLVEGRANRKWKDEGEVKEELDMLYGDEIFNMKLKSPAQMEKLIGDKDFISRFTEKPRGAITLVPRSDKRKEVLPSAIEDFKDN